MVMFVAPLSIEFKPSRRLLFILAASHLGALLILVPVTFPIWAKIILAFALALSAWRNARRYLWRNDPKSVLALRLYSAEKIEIMLADRTWQSAHIEGERFIHPLLVIVHCRLEESRKRIPVVILSDTLELERFRELRVRLKWQTK